jgi:PilZ domain
VRRGKTVDGLRAERRKAARVEPSRSARLIDVSPLGLAIETPTPIERGHVYDLILGLDDQRMPVSVRAVRVRRHGDLYRASFAFDRILDSDREHLQRSLVREVADRMTVILR